MKKVILYICLFVFGLTIQVHAQSKANLQAVYRLGAIERMDTSKQEIYLMFTGGDYNDGGDYIQQVLKEKNIPAHFFFTGDFYRKSANRRLIKRLVKQGHYLGAHSDQHLLYAAWENRDSLLVDKSVFTQDLLNNYKEMKRFGINKGAAPYFMPPYEWYNQQISDWTAEMDLTLINFSPGTRSNADYTTPDMGKRYLSSDFIFKRIFEYEQEDLNGLNGFFLLLHIGTDPIRTDKFYFQLPKLIDKLHELGYVFKRLPVSE
ncbi:MAG: hypothetical protein Sapg2KO_09280 [Saprospiraceae bacterium]